MIFALGVGGFGATACGAGRVSGYPLYPAVDPEPGPEQVARLTGYVRTVDGEDVARYGGSFRLLPGCHVVGTPATWGRSESGFGAVVVKTGEVFFALPMRAGHEYEVEVEVESSTTVIGEARLVAWERDGRGDVTREFAPIASAADASRCRAEAPGRRASPR